MRKSYLDNHRRGIYSGLLLSGELKKHLLMIQEQAEERFDLLVEQMAKQEGVTEQLKAQDQMLWVRRMRKNILLFGGAKVWNTLQLKKLQKNGIFQ